MDSGIQREVWLAGKGPGIDTYDWSQAGECRVCVNESVYLVPSPTHAIALDYGVQEKYMQSLPSGLIVFRKQDHRAYRFSRMLLYKRDRNIRLVKCTAAIAIQLIAYYGGKIIHFVGFDSLVGKTSNYADSICAMRAEGINNDCFKQINAYILAAINTTGVTPMWEDTND